MLVGALASYPLYLAISPITEVKLNKIIPNSSLLCGFLIGLFYLKLCRLSFQDAVGVGFKQKNLLYGLATSFAAGALILIIAVVCLLALGIYQPDPEVIYNLTFVLKILFKALFSGIFVAMIEETIFRGVLLGGLAKQTNIITALIISTFAYAVVHFIKFPPLPANTDINWLTGLDMLSHAFYRFTDPVTIDSFITLFSLGILLGMIRLQTGNIVQCVGLHAGIVFIYKMTGYLTNYQTGSPYDFLVNAYSRQLGYMATTCLSLAIILYFVFFMKNKTQHQLRT